ncbi:hypothetical protein RY831_07875 [Noviherbaspirillum sp. CPCC 100848]|uniref:GNAT family N-acetyltransferase n=1 Tax=Noviherbaspirillum album TaxID=3080276 RepID=A0ABU6J5Y0_9BURK|nr:hypothetical protein [Noviherbaspirillum sp. CPCC 100848]MEC4719062.1 hypothetical protein [Noviherbaspirillum sp. CPCC 100848]
MKIISRYLRPEDIPALLVLERAKWESHQAADAASLMLRIETFPQLCIGSFCADSGRALASLFMRPVSAQAFVAPTRWENAADVRLHHGAPDAGDALFGISLSSLDSKAVTQIFRFFHPRALKAGWRDIYLGSPIPGFRKARAQNPGLQVWQYAHARRGLRVNEPLDPQLRYYFRKGFKDIVSIQENYFPHEDSLNYGVIVRGSIPLSAPKQLWRHTPICILQTFSLLALR